ncbi:MAG: hypothetical protein PVH00_03395 [Gemmatimonadota bacterium]
MQNELKETERQAFRAVMDTGLWDVMIAGVVSMFAIAPLLSERLGDFWSSAVFVPVWACLYLALRVVRRRVVDPRVGVVRFGAKRRARLGRFSAIMVGVNVVALVGGVVFALRPEATFAPAIFLGLIILSGFSIAAWFLDIPRFFFYGVLLVVAAVVGELLFRRGLVSHHGYPVMFGSSALLIAAIGLLRFAKHLPPRAVSGGAMEAGGNHE